MQLAYVCIVCQHVCIHDNRRIVTSTPCGSEWNKLHGKMFCNKEINSTVIHQSIGLQSGDMHGDVPATPSPPTPGTCLILMWQAGRIRLWGTDFYIAHSAYSDRKNKHVATYHIFSHSSERLQVIFMFFVLGEGHSLKPPQIFSISMERMNHLVHSTQLLMTCSER